MGLFDFLGGGSEKERLSKLGHKLTQKYGPPEGRQKIIGQLSNMGTAAAYRTLAMRFTGYCEPSITDDEEKEQVRQILVAAKEDAVEPVKEFVREQEAGVAWGLRVLNEIAGEAAVVELVVQQLDRLGKEYTRDPEKKLTLMTWAMEHFPSNPALPPVLLPLLEDFSDEVRIKSTELLARQPLTEEARKALLELMVRDRENLRVRGVVLQALADLGADVKGYRPSVEELLVEPFFLDKEGLVKKRG